MLTLEHLAAGLDVRLVAGSPGVGRAVRWVHISELADPTPWLSGGELLLTTGPALNGPASQRAYLARLIDAGIAGLGLGVGFAHARVPKPLREAADAAGFPIYEVPYEVPFIAVTERAAFHILSESEVLRSRIARETERRLAGDVLSGLLSGDLRGDELVRRLEPFGFAPGGRAWALVLAPPPDRVDAVEEALDACGAALVASAGPLTCALAAGEEDFERAEALRRAAGEPLPAGAGRAVAVADVRRSVHEARCALDARGMGQLNGSAPLLATFRDLGSFQLLLSLQDDEALRLFCDSILGPIEHGEGAYGGELMRSLEVFIEANGQWERAAKQLYCHRHTLRYRIRRVEELTGRSLGSARDRIDFWLALRGRELIREESMA